MFNKKTFHILIKLFLVATNIHALFLVFSGEPKQIIIGIVILAVFYLFFFFNYIFDTGSVVYARNLSIKDETLGAAVHKGLQYTVKDITSYRVEENYLTKEKWEKLREELNLYAIGFLKRNFPYIKWDSQFYLKKYDEYVGGSFCPAERHENLFFDKPTPPITLNEVFVYAVIKFDDFEIIRTIVEHELVHYALWKQEQGYRDGEKDFESKLKELNIRSNNPKQTQLYSFSIKRDNTENGVFDTLQLLIPPNELAEEENYKPVLENYRQKYSSERSLP